VLITKADGATDPSDSPGLHDTELSSRPMEVARLDENCVLWFLTDADTGKVFEFRADPYVHVIAQDASDRFLSLRVLRE